jgi:hypothetical protein
MKKLTRFTGENGNPIFIDSAMVLAVDPIPNHGGTLIAFSGFNVRVKDGYEDVISKIQSECHKQ